MFMKCKQQLFFSTCICFLFGYSCFYNSDFQWWLLAHTRLLLIELLPYWDWTHLGNKRCLFVNPFIKKKEPVLFDYNFCWSCENTKSVINTEKLGKKDVQNVLNNLKKPMIFSNISTTSAVEESLDLDSFVDPKSWTPCYFQSNIKQKHFPTWYLRTNNQNWFAQWQLCDPFSLKRSRKLYKKPTLFPNSLSCMGPNWLFMSMSYQARIHRSIETIEDWVWFVQLIGDGHVQLIAPPECNDICFNLTFTLKQGDSVLMPQDIYYLQYMPNNNKLNVAVAVECHSH